MKTIRVKIKANEHIDKLKNSFDDETLFKILLARLRKKFHDLAHLFIGDTAIINFTGMDVIEHLKSKKAISKFEEKLLKKKIKDGFIILNGKFV